MFSRALLVTSAVLAVIAWVLFIILHIELRKNPAMWILTLGWPAYYAIVVGFAYGIAGAAMRGPLTSRWPALIRSIVPQPIRTFMDAFYIALPRFGLIAFPLMGVLIGAAAVFLP